MPLTWPLTRPRTGLRPYCSCEVAGLWLGIDVLEVQEVIRHRLPTRVPTAPIFVDGLINLRGQIVTVIDLRKRLGLAADPWLDRTMNVVVRSEGGAVGLVVDEVRDVVEVDESALEGVPETLNEPLRRQITGLYPLAGRSLLILDVRKIIDDHAGTQAHPGNFIK